MVQQYVWQLRKLLGAAAVRRSSRRRRVRAASDRERVDALRFERLVVDAAGSADAAAAGAAARRRARALARRAARGPVGSALRRGRSCGDWRSCAADAAELAIEGELAAGRAREAAGDRARSLAEHPAARAPARAADAGALPVRAARPRRSRPTARRATTLVERIGVEPGPELRRLHQAVLRQDAELDLEPRAPELPPELETAATPPLVGRDAELARLRGLWARRASGSRERWSALVGAPGMGKTRLAAELAADGARRGARCSTRPAAARRRWRAVAARDAAAAADAAVVDEPDEAVGAAALQALARASGGAARCSRW